MSCHVNGDLAKTSTQSSEELHQYLLFACLEHSRVDRCSTIDRRFSRAIPAVDCVEITRTSSRRAPALLRKKRRRLQQKKRRLRVEPTSKNGPGERLVHLHDGVGLDSPHPTTGLANLEQTCLTKTLFTLLRLELCAMPRGFAGTNRHGTPPIRGKNAKAGIVFVGKTQGSDARPPLSAVSPRGTRVVSPARRSTRTQP